MSLLVPAITTTTFQPAWTTSTPSLPRSSALTAAPVTTARDHVSTETFPPMTTHWSKPLSCTWTYIVDSDLESVGSGPIAWLDLEPVPGASTLSCYPDGMFVGGRTGVFSPATCPYGWTTVSVSRNPGEDPDLATTTVSCCSSEYSWINGHCMRQVPTVLAVPITYNHTASTYEVMTNSTTTLYGATIAVYTIQALFRDEDQGVLGITDDSEMDDEPAESHTLSLSARIGIGVGATIFGLIAIGAILFIFLRRQHGKSGHAKGRRSHELGAVRGVPGHLYGTSNPPHGPHRPSSTHDAEPPPAYDVATETNSLEDDESRHSTTNRDDEIRVLMAQKAAIQRRLDQLERAEAGENPDRARDE